MPDSATAREPNEEIDIETAVAQALEACGGDPMAALRATIVTIGFLEDQLDRLEKAISYGYARGQFLPPT